MKAKSLFGPWSGFRASDINRLLRPHGVRLVVKASKDWGKDVNVTAHPIVAVAKRVRVAAVHNGTIAELDAVHKAAGQK